MTTLQLSKQINAPVSEVYRIMLQKPTYEQWAKAFDPGSQIDGTWEKDSIMYFTCTGKDGLRQGMFSEVTDNVPDQKLALRHKGVIAGDAEVTEGSEAEPWVGTQEIYRFAEEAGVTTVSVEQDIDERYKDYFEGAWAEALEILKTLCEAKKEN